MAKQNPGTRMARNVAEFAILFFFLLVSSNAEISSNIGINYGRLGNNLPSPNQSIEIIKSLNAGRVKLYDANPEVLQLLSGSNIRVSVMVPNHEIINIASNQSLADKWVQNNVLPYYPGTRIRSVLVGNEVFSYFSEADRQVWLNLVQAMQRIKNSLTAYHVHNIKIGTPLAMDMLESSFPPSNGTFRSDVSHLVIVPLLKFLNETNSFFFIDVYPYFPWSANPCDASLNFALFQSNIKYTDPGSGLTYTNSLDQMLDSVIFAMIKLGYPNIRLVIAETGWPNSGDIDQPGANIYNAATYNRNLIKKMTSNPPIGTPARPGVVIHTFIFSLYDENQKNGPGTERHWGLFHANGTAAYEIDMSGKLLQSDYKPLPEPHNNRPYKGKLWCVVAKDADLMRLQTALTYACNQGNGTCDALVAGKDCYEPVSVIWHASYAFSSYWAQYRSQGATCYFDGLAEQTTKNPSGGSCEFPSVTL